jgi:hypothetical protein
LPENKKAPRFGEFAVSCHSFCRAVVYRLLPPRAGLPTGLVPGQAMSFNGMGVTIIVFFDPA